MFTLKEAYNLALEKTYDSIPKRSYSFNSSVSNLTKTIQSAEFKRAVQNKFGDFDKFQNETKLVIAQQKNIVAAFTSTPIAFANAWNMQVEELVASDVMSLAAAGGHFQFNQGIKGSKLYRTGFQHGLVKNQGGGLIIGFRHKTSGSYDEDNLSEMGVFTYATPEDASGMMEYRFHENFSELLGIPRLIILSQWFRYKTVLEDNNQWLYMTGIAKVVGTQDHPAKPIQLQLINREEAFRLLLAHEQLMTNNVNEKVRPPLPEHLRLGWSYEKIKANKKKRAALIKYAQERHHKCVGKLCGHVPFEKLEPSKIHIGHRISQHWNSQNSGVVDVHHPYNLYLSCDKCNISLQSKYPTELDNAINTVGTIGDWLMQGDLL